MTYINPDLKVLIVDGNAEGRSNIRQVLTSLNIVEIDGVSTGTEALQKLKDASFDVIFSALSLPDVKGTDLLEIVRYSPRLAELPFIIISEETQGGEFIDAVELGVTDYILKPFNTATFEERFEKALEGVDRPFVKWNDSLEVGILKMDAHHRRLMALINGLHDSIKLGRGRDKICSVLEELVRYTKVHFTAELNLLFVHQYPEHDVHQEKHKELTEQVVNLQSKLTKDVRGVSVETLQFLKTWLSDHIMQEDKKYAPFLKEKGVS